MSWGTDLASDLAALSYDASTQGYEPLAKDDTLYYARVVGGFVDLGDDLSQYNDDQDASGGSWTFEAAPASRFNVTTSWSIEADIDTDTGDTGRIYTYGTSGTTFIGLRIGNTPGLLDCILTIAGVNTVVGSLTLPGVSASNQNYIIGWSAEPNLATTGASDAIRSVLYAFNTDTGAYDQSVFTHPARVAGTAAQIWWASSTAGANRFLGTPNACRFSTSRFRTPAESREDFIGRTTAPTLASEYSIAYPIVDPACDLADPGQFAGPVHAQGAAAAAGAALRLFSPLVDAPVPEFDIFYDVDDETLFPSPWHSVVPVIPGEDVEYQLCGNLMWRGPMPPAATHARVRVQVLQTVISGTDTLSLRAYSMNRPPDAAHVLDHDQSFQEQHVTATHAASSEGWLEFEDLPLVRNSAGETWVAIGIGFTVSGDMDDFLLHAVTVEPLIA